MTPIEVVVVGASSGGLSAMETLLSALPDDFRTPLVAVQHRLAESDERLVGLLQKHTKLRVCEAEDKDELVSQCVYLAPCDYHLLLERNRLALSTEAPVCSARPSIDVLFESAARSYGPASLAVVLTGATADGAAGAASIGRAGGVVLVQDPETAESRMMPRAAIDATPSAQALPLLELTRRVGELCRRGEGRGAHGC